MTTRAQYKLAYSHARIVLKHNSSYAHYEQVTSRFSTLAVDNAWLSMCWSRGIDYTGMRYRVMVVNPALKYSSKESWRGFCHWMYTGEG